MSKTLLRRACPECDSISVATERRPDGDTICADCGHKDKTIKFDSYVSNPPEYLQVFFKPKTKSGTVLNPIAFNLKTDSRFMEKTIANDVFVEDGFTYSIDYEITAILKRIPNFVD